MSQEEETWRDVRPQEGKQTLAFTTKVDFMLYGGARGAGKSRLLNMRPLEYVDDKYFKGIFFRREYGELTGEGGLWQTAGDLYPLFGATPNVSNLRYSFPAGAGLRFSHMYTEADKEKHRGLQYSFIGFDEIDHFTKEQVQFLLTCLRSEANMDSFCIGTLNPNPDSWCLELVEWYLDEKGFPREDRCGAVRYFIVVDGEFIFGGSEEYFQKNYPASVYINNRVTGEDIYIPPKTFTFISGNVFDNPALLAKNPRYLSELQNLPDHERDRQLWGNWYARPSGSAYFDRKWLVPVDKIPMGTKSCRAWDKASTEPSEINKYPDYTAGSPRVHKCSDGFFWIVWDFLDDITDDINDSNIPNGKFRKRAGERDQLMLKQAKADGTDCKIVIAVDPGSNGKDAFESTKKKFMAEGFDVVPDPMPSNKSKLVRFEPFASAAQDGLIRVVRSSFPNDKTYNAFMKECEAFDGERSTSSRKDDWPDAIASAVNYLAREKTLPTFSLGVNNSQSRFAEINSQAIPDFR